MGKYHLPHWLQLAVATTGGFGLFLAAFLDSSVLSLPAVNDLLLIDLSIASPSRMPYYAAMATLGSLAGCLLLYVLARKGGQAAFRRRAGERAPRIHRWMKRNGFVSLLVAAVLPPPAPFKFFVLAAGALEMPWRQFVVALVIARGARFFGEGFLSVRYGPQAIRFLSQHKLAVTLGALAAILAVYLISRLFSRSRRAEGT
jgi:membrane protein YqaA with SNARE-associated domain